MFSISLAIKKCRKGEEKSFPQAQQGPQNGLAVFERERTEPEGKRFFEDRRFDGTATAQKEHLPALGSLRREPSTRSRVLLETRHGLERSGDHPISLS